MMWNRTKQFSIEEELDIEDQHEALNVFGTAVKHKKVHNPYTLFPKISRIIWAQIAKKKKA